MVSGVLASGPPQDGVRGPETHASGECTSASRAAASRMAARWAWSAWASATRCWRASAAASRAWERVAMFLSHGRQLRVLDRGRGVRLGELDLVQAGHQGLGRRVRVLDFGSTFVSGAGFY